MPRVRSPNYPALSLPEAIEAVTKIHMAEQHLAAPKEVVAKHLGYASFHGLAGRIVSAVEKYGLLEDVNDDKVKVSPLAMSILFPSGLQEKQRAINEAAFKPPLFAAIKEEWQGERPSDQNLRVYLVRKKFGSDALDRVIGIYKETMDLVTPESGVYSVSKPDILGQGQDKNVPMVSPAGSIATSSPSIPSAGGEPFRMSIAGNHIDLVARLETPEQIDQLMYKLKFAKLMITPVGGPMATEYENSKEGEEAKRHAEERHRLARERE